jgi:hypothetical protein
MYFTCLILSHESAIHDKILRCRWSTPTKKTSDIAAFILISTPVGNWDRSLAVASVFRSRDVPDVAYGGLLRLAVRLTTELDLGYMAVVMSVAASCGELVKAACLEGFVEVATVPEGINMVEAGLTGLVLLLRRLGLGDRPVRHTFFFTCAF